MRGWRRATRVAGQDPEAFKWAVIAAAVAMMITAGVARFGPEHPITGADHQRVEQMLRGITPN